MEGMIVAEVLMSSSQGAIVKSSRRGPPYLSSYMVDYCHTPDLKSRTEASIRVPWMFKSHT
jgi:hypothetical protein